MLTNPANLPLTIAQAAADAQAAAESHTNPLVLWGGFVVFILAFIAVDLWAFGRHPGAVTTKAALRWTGLCVFLALAFVPFLAWIYEGHHFGRGLDTSGEHIGGTRAASLFLQGWLLEYAMSVDNLFVFALIFRHFRVPDAHQHRVLTWGILATLVMRGGMIASAIAVIHWLEWVLYIAGAFLIWTAYKMLFGQSETFDPQTSRAVRLVRRIMPVTDFYCEDKFFVRDPNHGGRLAATPMLLVLMVLNVVDLVFAVDSVPAILSVTSDSFIVFSATMFAILGLRALYFVLAQAMHDFHYLGVSLAIILAFVGVKMLAEGLHHLHRLEGPMPSLKPALAWLPKEPLEMSPYLSLGIIAACLGAGVFASLALKKRPDEPAPH